jgi:UDPglucose 6-dehydrogenase
MPDTRTQNGEFPLFAWALGRQCTARVAPGAVVIDTRNIVDREAVTGSQLVCLGNGTVGGY